MSATVNFLLSIIETLFTDVHVEDRQINGQNIHFEPFGFVGITKWGIHCFCAETKSRLQTELGSLDEVVAWLHEQKAEVDRIAVLLEAASEFQCGSREIWRDESRWDSSLDLTLSHHREKTLASWAAILKIEAAGNVRDTNSVFRMDNGCWHLG